MKRLYTGFEVCCAGSVFMSAHCLINGTASAVSVCGVQVVRVTGLDRRRLT